jgi:hypothetical protein
MLRTDGNFSAANYGNIVFFLKNMVISSSLSLKKHKFVPNQPQRVQFEQQLQGCTSTASSALNRAHDAFLKEPTAQPHRRRNTCSPAGRSRSSRRPGFSHPSRPFARGIGFLAQPPTPSSPPLPPSRRERRPEKRKKKTAARRTNLLLPYLSTPRVLIRQFCPGIQAKC